MVLGASLLEYCLFSVDVLTYFLFFVSFTLSLCLTREECNERLEREKAMRGLGPTPKRGQKKQYFLSEGRHVLASRIL